MKYTYKQIYKWILTKSFDKKTGEPLFMKMSLGGTFVDKDGNEAKLTPQYVLDKYRDWTKQCVNDLGSFFGRSEPITTIRSINPFFRDKLSKRQIEDSKKFEIENSACNLGKWKKEMENEKDLNLYYFQKDGFIHKMFIYKVDSLDFGKITNYDYVLELNGNMLSSLPDEGDIIYDSLSEAKKTLKKRFKK